MLLADNGLGGRIQASPGAAGWCPLCKEPLTPKCGEIVSWHWSHRAGSDCDPWAEGESAWHLAWKAEFDESQVENPIGRHRADIIAGGTVIELQHSSLKPEEVREREDFYLREVGRIIWVIDMTTADISFTHAGDPDSRVHQFLWSRPRKWLLACTTRVYWDLGDGVMFRMGHLNADGTSLLGRRFRNSNGWGFMGTKDEFLSFFRGGDKAA